MDTLGLGLIGYGSFGRFCAEAYETLPGVRLVAVAEQDPQRREEAARQLGVSVYAKASDLWVLPEVDLVHISTPPHTHALLSNAAARAGKHIFCEKPMATSVDEAGEVIEELQANDIRFMVNYVQRFNPLNNRLRELLRLNILGLLHHFSLENWATDEPLKPDHWFWRPEICGGIWIEHGVHFFDLLYWLTGEEADAVSATSRVRPDGCLDRVWALVRYADDLVAGFQHAFTQPTRIEQTTMRLACARGYVTLYGWIPTRMVVDALVDDQGHQMIRDWAGGEPEVLERYSGDQTQGWAFGEPYRATARLKVELSLPQGKLEVYRESIRAAMSDLIASIHDKRRSPSISVQEAWTSLAVAESATMADLTGKWELVKRVT